MSGASEAATVFVIDDDDAVRDSLKLLLESHALCVREFASGQEFLDSVGPSPRGCLILDLHLPVISGLEFLLRFSSRLRDMPVILLTGRPDATTRSRALEAGVAEVGRPGPPDRWRLDPLARRQDGERRCTSRGDRGIGER